MTRECDSCGCMASPLYEVCESCLDVISDGGKSCRPLPLKDEYLCMNTKRAFRWDGDHPEFCPRCGGEWRR